jgi:T5SS/PEP-CTERM-associated repeat protein
MSNTNPTKGIPNNLANLGTVSPDQINQDAWTNPINADEYGAASLSLYGAVTPAATSGPLSSAASTDVAATIPPNPTEGAAAAGKFVINAVYDSSITNLAPTMAAQVLGAITAAIDYYEGIFTNAMTVTLDFGWGEIQGGTLLASAVAESNPGTFIAVNYTTMANALTNADTSLNGVIAAATLPPSDPTTSGIWDLTPANALALGIPGESQGLFAGYVSLNNAFNFTFDPNNRAVSGEMDAIGALEHEISEDLGRRSGMGGTYEFAGAYSPVDLFRYTASGARQLTPGPTNAYLSTDGKTLLTEFNNPLNGGDGADWIPTLQGDSYGDSFPGVEGTISAADLQFMNVLGYSETVAPPISGIVWTGADHTTDYNDVKNWAPKRLPIATDDVVIPAGANVIFANDPTAEVDSLQLGVGARFQINQGDFTIDNGGTSTNNQGTIDIASGDGGLDVSVHLAGSLNNTGLIRFNGPGAELLTNSTTVTIGGSGTILLVQGDIGGRSFIDTSPFDTLINQANTIEGSGVIGLNGFLNTISFINGGTVAATTAAASLSLTNPVVNKGVLEAISGGRLILAESVDNRVNGLGTGGASIKALTGSTVELSSASVLGGTVGVASGGGTIEISGQSTLDGSNTGGLALAGNLVVDAASVLTLTGSINGGTLTTTQGLVLGSNVSLNGITLLSTAMLAVDGGSELTLLGIITDHGAIEVNGDAAGITTATLLANGTVSLIGGGSLILADASGAQSATRQLVTGSHATDTLDNVAATISGYGNLGAGDGLFTLLNEAGGTIDAVTGSLIVNTGTHAVVNKGVLESTTGELYLYGTVTNLSTITAVGGTVLDNVIVTGGVLAGSGFQAVGIATLNGLGTGITIAPGGQIAVGVGETIALEGSVVNHGLLNVLGDSYNNLTGAVRIIGTTALTGGGSVFLTGTAPQNQIITGTLATSKLDNIDNTIRGTGLLGAGKLTLVNEAAGMIEAIGGTLVVNTGTNVVSNLGLMEAVGGTLDIQGVVDGTKGGIIATLQGASGSGVVQLDGATLRGGTLRTDPADASSQVQATANGGTLDGSAGALTLAPGAIVSVVPGGSLTVEGTITNHGTLIVDGDGYTPTPGTLLISGAVTLSGGGLLSLADVSTLTNATTSQVVTGTSATATLDNIDNLITGYGELGAAQLTLTNEAKGVIEATVGNLVIDSGTKVDVNKGLIEASGGVLTLRGVFNDTGGGTIAALNSGLASGIVVLDGATLRGGTIVTDLNDPASVLTTTVNGGTLDGTAGAVTLAAGAQVEVTALQTLTLQGTIAGPGTIDIQGDGYSPAIATARLANNTTLTGGGRIVLADVSTLTLATNSQVITGATASTTLDNLSDTILGYGELGAGNMTLINAAGGTVYATVGLLRIDTGAKAVTNQGLLEAVGGTLEIDSAVTNSGTIAAGTAGDAVINSIVTNTGLVSAGNAGTVTLHGTIAGATGTVQVASGGTLLLDGGSIRGGTLTNAATGLIDITSGSGTLAGVTFVNAGLTEITGDGYSPYPATLTVSGTTTLSGGGSVLLTDISTLTNSSTSQIITGLLASDTLDNVNNTISGYGELGAGRLTVINEAAGTIAATTAELILNTGSVALANRGLLEAKGSTLLVQTAVDSTTGGTVAAFASGTAPGIVLLDGGTIRGGTIVTDLSNPLSALLLAANGGTLDGTASAVTLAIGSHAIVMGGETLTLKGTIAEHGTLDVFGDGYSPLVAEVLIAGTVTLSNGGQITLADVSTLTNVATSQIITAAAAGAKLDNAVVISGAGLLGDGNLALTNEASGTIEATVGSLVVDSGASKNLNLGQMLAFNGTLQLENTVSNAATIAAGAAGVVIIDGSVTNTGLVTAGNAGTLTLHGTIAGATGTVQVASGGTLLLDGGSIRGGTLTNAATGLIDITSGSGTLAGVTFVNAGLTEITGEGYSPYPATLTVSGTTTLSGGGSVLLTDISTLTNSSTSQIITGLLASDTLDNVNNTISGYGELGAGRLTVINEAAGTIAATTAELILNTGSVALANRGLLEAKGSTLLVQTAVDSTTGGTVAAFASGTAPGIVLLDGGTIRGGAIITDAVSAVMLTVNGGTLDGSSGAVTIGIGSHVTIGPNAALTLEGSIVDHGRIDLQGDGYSPYPATLTVSGTTTLSGGGSVLLADISTLTTSSTSQIITGASASATLDNVDNTIAGYGEVGAGNLTLINDSAGTIDASGADLIVDAGPTGSLTNRGLMEAVSGTLDVVSTLANSGVILAAGGTVLVEGSVTGIGRLELDGSNLWLEGSVAAGQTILYGNFDATETLEIASAPQIAATIGGLASPDTIIVQNVSLSSASYHTTTGTLGALVLLSGTTAVGTLTLAGTYTTSDFKVNALADGTSAITLIPGIGTIYHHATASAAAPNPVNFGQRHVGDTLNHALSISNTAVAGAGSESLGGSIGNTTGPVVASGSFSGLTPGLADTTDLSVGLSSAVDGVRKGTAVLALSTDGTGIDFLGVTPLKSQTIAVSGTLFSYATASAVAPVSFGSRHVGDTLSQVLSITNTGAADGFTEKLDGTIAAVSGAATAIGSFRTLAAGHTDSSSLTVKLTATQDGVRSGTVVLGLNSNGTGIDTLGTTAIAGETIVATGTLYNYATASTAAPLSLGNHHVGDKISQALIITNAGTADGFTENLDASIGGTTGAVSASGSIIGLGASKTDSAGLIVGLSSSTDGVRAGTVKLALASEGGGIDSLGTTVLATQTIAITGTVYNYATATVLSPSTTNFGHRHVGDELVVGVSMMNLGTVDGFTEKLDIGFGATVGAGLAGIGTNISNTGFSLTAGNAQAIGFGLSSAHDGVQSGFATVLLSSDGTGIDNLGTTALASQTLAATGTLYNYATASTPLVVNFGNHHIGDILAQTLTVTNTGTADGFTEALDASLGGATGSLTAKGTFAGLGASISNSSSLTIALADTKDGKDTGTAVLSVTSDGTGIDGLGTTARQAQTITASATVYALAVPIVSATTLDFGASRLGSLQPSRSLTISDGTTADLYQENLSYQLHSLAGFALTSAVAVAGTVVSGSHATGSWTVNPVNSGIITVKGNLLDFTSVGATGLANTTLASAPLTLTAKVYAAAIAQLSSSSVNFGVVHVGDTISVTDTITNAVNGALTDVLTGHVGTVTGSFSASGTLGAGLAAGASKTLSLALNTGTAGVFSGSAALVFASHDTDLTDAAVTAGPITLSGTVDNYATATIEDLAGGGSFTQNGSLFSLNLGAVAQGSSVKVAGLGVLNAAAGLADLLSGSFAVGGSGFINNGLTAFTGLAAGQADILPTISLTTGTLGVFTETITLVATGSNASGFSAALPREVLTVTGTVVPGARTLVWTGGGNTDFANPLNWNDTTSGTNPALKAPNAIDTALFGSGGGGITGSGVASALSFAGNGTWNLETGTTLTTTGSLTVGSTLPGDLVINAGATIVGTGTATAVIGDQAGASGSSVTVRGTGSDWKIGGSLIVGNAGFGELSLAQGGTVTATSLDLGAAAGGDGVVSVVGTQSALSVTGDITVGDQSTGELTILGGAHVSGYNLTVGGTGASSASSVDMEGNGSHLTLTGDLDIGVSSQGIFSFGAGSTLTVTGTIYNGPNGVENLLGFLDPAYLINDNTGSLGSVEFVDVAVENSGQYSVIGNSVTIDTPLITFDPNDEGSSNGEFLIGNAGTLVLNASSVDDSQLIKFSATNAVLVIGQQPVVDSHGLITGAIAPGSPNVLPNFQAVLQNFKAGDQIELPGLAYGSTTESSGVVTLWSGAAGTGTDLGSLDFITATGAPDTKGATAAGTFLTSNVLCFLAGTLLATPSGQTAVERLKTGDVVLTASGQARPIVWIGVGRVLATRGRRNAATPVIVRKGALSANVPYDDLRVTKGHAFLLDGVLIPVEFLVNHRSILWDDRAQEVSIYHVELETHDVLLANGAPAESYRDDGNRWLFQNANTGWDQPPKPPCAPVLTGGPVVDTVWRRLLDMCGRRPGMPLTEEPDLHLVVDGVRVEAAERTDGVYVFALSRVPSEVRVASRLAVPQELGVARDPRSLGVAVKRIAVRRGSRFKVLLAGDASLRDGFHSVEPGSGLHWTDGDAIVPAGVFDGFAGECEVVVQVDGTTLYVDDGARAAVA